MFEQGYIMREVQKMTQMIQDIIGLKREKKLDEALRKIDQSYDRFFDLHKNDLKDEKLDNLVRLCTCDGKFSADLGFALADLVNEEAQVLEMKGENKQAKEKYSLVLNLYRRALQQKDAAVPLTAVQKIKNLEQKVEAGKKD